MHEDSIRPGAGIDRRSLIRGGAAVGVLAWAAPTVTALPAHAQEPFCTPKCVPETFTIIALGEDQCDVDLPPGAVVDNNTKSARFTIGTPGDLRCPCGDEEFVEFRIISVPTFFDKGNSANFANAIADPDDPAVFYIYKSGSLGNGLYTPADPGLCVAIRCTDRDGDDIWRICTIKPQFDYTPAGSCDTIVVVPVIQDTNPTCGIVCGRDPVPGDCP